MAVNAKGLSMDARRLVTVVALVVAALVAVPAVASAKTLEFRGVVSGSPYGASNGYMAVPVLYSKQTAHNAGLKSPVGLLVVKRTQSVKLPGGAKPVLPIGLRTGDRFRGRAPMKSSYRQSFYPRITFSSVSVYFRSAELSLAEISAAIDALRKATADLQAQLNSLKASSIKAFQDIYAQLEELKKAIAALQGLQVPNFQSQIDALNKRIDDLIAGLPDFSKLALLTDLPDLSQYVKLSDLSSLLGSNTVITTLQTQVSALQSTVSSLTTQVTTLTTRLNNVCTALKTATIDPDGAGPLGSIGVISLPGITSVNACGP
jgi:chaperonin cofactor prefoldin